MIGLGIDTGGTCTDAVLYDMDGHQVMSTGKTLTTKNNLEQGIDTALSQLDPVLLSKVEFVSLSTTLATNACVEGRGGRVKLLLIGIKRSTVEESYQKYGFDSMDDFVFIDGEPKEGKEPDFSQLKDQLPLFEGCSGIAISQVYASKNGGAFEKQAKEILEAAYDVPVICAYELFSDLNAIRRGAGAYLNARLIPLIESFLVAVKRVLKKRGLTAPVYIVRSDGSLMNEAFTRKHPVETLLCGPAASALGGAYLADEKQAMIIDIGGTTTDVALIQNHALKPVSDGITIGEWKTFVKGMYVDTFGLGGDTAVKYDHDQLLLEDYRVMPVCMAAAQYPELKKRLMANCAQSKYSWVGLYEGFVYIHDLDFPEMYEPREVKLLEALKEGPLLLHEASRVYGADLYMMNTRRLEAEGAILRFGLTPTDMMHVTGDYVEYDVEAAEAAFSWLSYQMECPKETLTAKIADMVKRRLYVQLVRILLENDHAIYQKGVPEAVMDLIGLSYDDKNFQHLRSSFGTDYTLIGVGAPTHVFLKDVAEKLDAKVVLPEYAKVANALGTLAGRISVTKKISIDRTADVDESYQFFIEGKEYIYEKIADAESMAKTLLTTIAEEEVIRRGGDGEISYVVEQNQIKPELRYGTMLLGSQIVVTAYAYPKKKQ